MSSLKDVAKLAGVSTATASRAITGSLPVDGSTRDRVLAAVQQLRYRPNLIARGLRKRSGKLIGFMVPKIMHETFASFIDQVESSCLERGFTMILGNTREDPAREAETLGRLIGLNIDGIVISRISDQSAVLGQLRDSGIPAVVIDRALEQEGIESVVIDNKLAGALAAQHLIDNGHRKLACITGPQSISLSRERLEGFVNAAAKRGISIPSHMVVEGDFGFDSGTCACETILERDPGVTAIWAQSDLMAIGARRALAQRGLSVPGDISLLGMDGTQNARMQEPALSTISQPFAEMCAKAIDMLISKMNGETPTAQQVVLLPKLLPGGTVAAPKS